MSDKWMTIDSFRKPENGMPKSAIVYADGVVGGRRIAPRVLLRILAGGGRTQAPAITTLSALRIGQFPTGNLSPSSPLIFREDASHD
jgi:hypothetical protein